MEIFPLWTTKLPVIYCEFLQEQVTSRLIDFSFRLFKSIVFFFPALIEVLNFLRICLIMYFITGLLLLFPLSSSETFLRSCKASHFFSLCTSTTTLLASLFLKCGHPERMLPYRNCAFPTDFQHSQHSFNIFVSVCLLPLSRKMTA